MPDSDKPGMSAEEAMRCLERLDDPVEDGIRVIAYGLLAFTVGLVLLGLMMLSMAWWR